MQILIRDATEADLPLIRRFTVETGWGGFSESQRRELNREEWSGHMLQVFEDFSKREGSRIFVAEDEAKAFVGYVWVGESSNMMTGKTVGFIYDVFVVEEARGKGIGKMLVEKAQSYCEEKGYPRISLMVSAGNKPAIRLYEAMGFKTEQMFMEKELR